MGSVVRNPSFRNLIKTLLFLAATLPFFIPMFLMYKLPIGRTASEDHSVAHREEEAAVPLSTQEFRDSSLSNSFQDEIDADEAVEDSKALISGEAEAALPLTTQLESAAAELALSREPDPEGPTIQPRIQQVRPQALEQRSVDPKLVRLGLQRNHPQATRLQDLRELAERAQKGPQLPARTSPEEVVEVAAVPAKLPVSVPSRLPVPSRGATTDVAIGVAKGLKPEGIRTFLETLRRWSNADVFLYVDAVPQGMDLQGVKFLTFKQEELGLPWSRYHPSSYRYYLYHQFMKGEGRKYSRVQACDIRDVAFQGDPFEIVSLGEDGVHIFEEDAGMNIGKCWVNSNWIRACYGHMQGRIAGRPISCSGYAIGTAAAMEKYFEVMAGELLRNTRCEQNGIDQGIHNVLVNWQMAGWKATGGYEHSPLPEFFSHTNERGPVYTGGYAPKGQYIQAADHSFQNHDHVNYKVLHQYDRHVFMTEELQKVTEALASENRRKSQPMQISTLPLHDSTATPALCGPSNSARGSAVFFNVQMDPAQKQWFIKRNSGELLFINSLVAELEREGWEVETSGDRSHVMNKVSAVLNDPVALSRTLFFFDRDTLTNFTPLNTWEQLRCHVRILDFFGKNPTNTDSSKTEDGLDLKQYLTPYPNEWNEFIGFPVVVPMKMRPPKRRQGVIWGKNSKYFQEHLSLIHQIAALVPLHVVLEEGSLRVPGVTSHSFMSHEDWLQLVTESSFFIGFGDPIAGPSVMYSIAVGTPYLDFTFTPPRRQINGVEYTSQHPFAATFGAPYIYPIHAENSSQVMETVERVLKAPGFNPFIVEDMKPESYRLKVKSIICKSFCTV